MNHLNNMSENWWSICDGEDGARTELGAVWKELKLELKHFGLQSRVVRISAKLRWESAVRKWNE